MISIRLKTQRQRFVTVTAVLMAVLLSTTALGQTEAAADVYVNGLNTTAVGNLVNMLKENPQMTFVL